MREELHAWGRSGIGCWLGYLSSTSVYGDWGGSWVNEGCESHLRFLAGRLSIPGLCNLNWAVLPCGHAIMLNRLGARPQLLAVLWEEEKQPFYCRLHG